MLEQRPEMKLSEYAKLYDILVPQTHPLRQILQLVDFSFIYDELKTKYCPDNGRNAEDPVRMFQYLFLKVFYDLSDRDLVDRARTDLAFKFFLGLNPEDPVIEHTTLSKFRRQRLKDADLLDILIKKSVEIAIKHNLIKSKTIIVDSMHTVSRFNPKRPIDALREQSKKLRHELYVVDESIKSELPQKPDTNDLEAEQVYCQKLIELVGTHTELQFNGKVAKRLHRLEEITEDIQSEQIISADKSAKIGHKTADSSFFGYKFHTAISFEGFIVAGIVTSGERSDGQYLKPLVKQAKINGVEIEEVIGDKAYPSKDNLKWAKATDFTLIARLTSMISNGTRKNPWDYNKDAGLIVCPAGQMAIRKNHGGRKTGGNRNPVMTYYFDVEICKKCPLRDGCYKPDAKSKSYSISIKSEEHQEQMAFEKTKVFRQKVRERYRIEQKNSELKNRYGCRRSWSNDITGMNLQGAIAAFCANLKLTIRLIDQENEK